MYIDQFHYHILRLSRKFFLGKHRDNVLNHKFVHVERMDFLMSIQQESTFHQGMDFPSCLQDKHKLVLGLIRYIEHFVRILLQDIGKYIFLLSFLYNHYYICTMLHGFQVCR